ncbi:PAS domain-containing hybrid sensor histidine kinase/response regulator [Cognaticolwellia mytili]|uniref:PAS domain-containing hybrid sensor histidine kinase/response regulator n=1 Tax=Cognaticolwellia mytili TaxID=1888913 RepID=UPI000A177ADE|nr:PAS domain-containing hybrid sensor histidine kinase/response regulator [Cognaticolwellia mytili]
MLAWLSLDTWFISFIAIAYLATLFVVAYWGENQSIKHWKSKPWIYSLSLGVSCTSWAFYGTVGQAATTGAWLAPIYIGTILCLVLAWPMLLKILKIVKQQNLTSIADFIAFRYDRSPKIAATVALIALVGTIPYIALQLRAISTSFDLLTGTYQSGISTAFIVTTVLIVFSILFGTRQIAASKQNQGLVLAIAFSSVVKLLALTAIGIFATFFIFDGFNDLLTQQQNLGKATDTLTGSNSFYLAIAQATLGAITVFILPQQFHMMMIENHHQQELKSARWLYPGYLLLINIFVLPIAIAGQLTFPGGSVDADTYVLTIPLFYQQAWLGVLVFVGGLAAATSMVIVAAIVLSTVISTELLTPAILKLRLFQRQPSRQLSKVFVNLRRISIAVILLLAFAFERILDQQNHLASIGLLSFVLLAQIAPATIGALYWRKATTKGAFIGLIVGSLMWFYTLLLPAIIPALMPEATWLENGAFGLLWLKPTSLFGITAFDAVSHGVFLSLLANVLCYFSISTLGHRSVGEKLQAELFVNKSQRQFERDLSIDDLYSLLLRFIDQDAADDFLSYTKNTESQHTNKTDNRHHKLIEYTRIQLSGVLGSASTRMVMKAASTSDDVPLEDVVSIVDEANQMFRFNRELLQSGVENIEQGICVVDADMRVVAWNQRYIHLLNYPEGLVNAGKPIEELIHYNIDQGVIKGDEAHNIVARRLEHMRQGNRHHFQRTMPNGVVLEIRGQPMPAGGFVSTFSDITAHIEAEKALQQANESLEKRVAQRTEQLQQAKAEAEAANSSKTRFLAAASHDLMQPFNALSLFTSMLKKKVKNDELADLANHIDDSLNVVEALLSDLVEISRLDGTSLSVDNKDFAINELLTPLKNEFTLLAEQEQILFHYVESKHYVNTDKRMLRRIIQNFLSNAVHYCNDKNASKAQQKNKILLGVRQLKHHLRIQVWDNGPGIAPSHQQRIFQEFERLEQNREVPGLGLGLAISERIAKLLGLQISLRSIEGKGTVFMIDVPRGAAEINTYQKPREVSSEIQPERFNPLSEPILVIDNDSLMLTAMASQLKDWGFTVVTAKDQVSAESKLKISAIKPAFIVADYHLDDDKNGVDLLQNLFAKFNWQVPCVICSADPSELVRQHTSDANFQFLRKPVKALALKRTIRQLLA